MTKSQNKIGTTDPRQMSLLNLLQRSSELRETPSDEGSHNVHPRPSHSMADFIRACGLGLYEIAGRMSHLLGWKIIRAMLDSWTAESKEQHRPSAEVQKLRGDEQPTQFLIVKLF